MKVNYTLKCYSPDTNSEITSVKNGQLFDLAMLVQDLRPNSIYYNPYAGANLPLIRGVFAAYANVKYNTALSAPMTVEVQILDFQNAPITGFFYLKFNNKYSTWIWYDNTTTLSKLNTLNSIQNALNGLFGVNNIVVTNPVGNRYQVDFVGFPSVNEPLLQPSLPSIVVTETISGEAYKFSSNYPNGKNVVLTQNGFVSLGGFSGSFNGLNSNQLEVVRVKMIAKAIGTQSFSINFDNVQSPMYDTLVYGNLGANPPEQSLVLPADISVNPTTLTITL